MKKYHLLLLLICFVFAVKAQSEGPQPVTPQIAQKINAEIEKELPAFLIKLEKNNQERTDEFDASVKFCTDTFRIERFYSKAMDYDYSTLGMNNATYAAAAKYDALMNRYYKLLAAKLKPADKAALLAAQRSWLAFRDNEGKLQDALTKEEYSGGGTRQSIILASEYYEMVKKRVLELWQYYAGLYN